MDQIAKRILLLRERITEIADRSGRDPNSIQIVVVSKTKPIELIRHAIKNGIDHIGENRVQEAKAKKSKIDLPAKWHLVGHLQTNKVKHTIEIFDLIHSVDSLKLIDAIDHRSRIADRKTDLLIQFNTSGETTKFGLDPKRWREFFDHASELKNVQICGLMTIAKFDPNPENSRSSFAKLRELTNLISDQNYTNVKMEYLSMGMTNDFEVAIEEGANLIRIGTAIFGKRS